MRGKSNLAVELGARHTVVTAACDPGLKYLSGDLLRFKGSSQDRDGERRPELPPTTGPTMSDRG